MSPPGKPQPPLEPRRGTIMETDEEIVAAMLTGKAPPMPAARPVLRTAMPVQQAIPLVPVVPVVPMVPVAPVAAPPAKQAAAKQAPMKQNPAAAFRPSLRDPLAILIVCDDGDKDGEIIRLRSDRFVIGRTEGDLTLPFDGLISGRHLEITRQRVGGASQWLITDLQSSNGLFVRVSRSPLGTSAEILVGRGRYLFEAPAGASEAIHRPGGTDQTFGWTGESPMSMPTLTELIGGGGGNKTHLARAEYWIGSDPACAICRPDDPFVEPRHARLFRDPKGLWQIEHDKTLNGIWLRKTQIEVDSTCQFQIGEQRFRMRIGGG